MSKKIRSRYIVEVQIEKSYIRLIDSNNTSYYIDLTKDYELEHDIVAEFKEWFNEVFSKGLPQHLTVFEYVEVEHDSQIDLIVTQILNLPTTSHTSKSII